MAQRVGGENLSAAITRSAPSAQGKAYTERDGLAWRDSRGAPASEAGESAGHGKSGATVAAVDDVG
ncbi:hypothetical protein GCM10025857_27610 [Alicyclobacillus contaminans]|nr:hypothetical protein GCM10025857_27610 [Alicyclobacillus contaminans]